MLRRPPGHVAPQPKFLLALALILLPWLPLADAQQQHSRPPVPAHQPRSPPEDGRHVHVAPNLAATAVTDRKKTAETPLIHQRRKTTVSRGADHNHNHAGVPSPHTPLSNDVYIPDDARADALALDLSVRAPPPSNYRSPAPGDGLSQQVARSLEDWEVEDFVLLATVDGDLYASDRKTGQERWHFKAGRPLVETRHFRTNRSVLDEDYDPIDHYIWVVEPTRDGELYLWRPGENGAGLAKMAWTMKKVVEELSPLNDKVNGVVYTGDKKTTMVTLNAATGTVVKEFGSSGSYVNKVESESCFKPNALADGDSEECSDGTITLGRTEYTVIIHRADGSPIASLKYSEWGPNTQDNDLIQQNHISKDSRYIMSQHDGKIYGFHFGRVNEERPLFTTTLSSPVARVFDVLHRWGAPPGAEPELIVLPQPPLPSGDDDNVQLRNEKVFINQTEQGSWYALSGSRYLILSAPAAPIHKLGWWTIKDKWEILDDDERSSVLVGTHQLPDGLGPVDSIPRTPLSIDPPREPEIGSPTDGDAETLHASPSPGSGGIFGVAGRLPELAVIKVFDLISNPAAIVLFFVTMWLLYKDRLPSVNRKPPAKSGVLESMIEVNPTVPSPAASSVEQPSAADAKEPKVEEVTTPGAALDEKSNEPSPARQPANPETPANAEPADPPEAAAEPAADGADNTPDDAGADLAKKKKGTRSRGRRGGTKHKKGNKAKREGSQSHDDDPAQETVDEAVKKAKAIGREPKLEPDIITVPGGADEVSGHILKMGSLEVNEAEQLGTGSNGTIVFAGKWDGRDVAVKRMLVQFNEIASQETRLLRESDDHPNGEYSAAFPLPQLSLPFTPSFPLTKTSDPLLCPARARRLPLHSTRALPSVARRRRPEASQL